MVEKYKLYSGIFFGTMIVMVTFPFVSQELITTLKPLHVPVFLIADVIFLLMGFATLRSRRDILVLVSFAILGIVSSIFINHESLLFTINGSRLYFGVIFSIPILRWFLSGKNGDRFMATFDKLLFYFLVIQVPCILWQFLKYGAGDRVGGSLGDWSSGVVSSLIYTISFYLVSKKWDYSDYLGSIRKNYVYFLLLLPTFFNETKASFVYLVMYFLLLLPLSLKVAKQLIWIVPCMMVIISGVGIVYLKVTNQEADRVLSVDFFKEYFFGESTDHVLDLALAVEDEGLVVDDTWNNVVDVPRFTRMILLPSVFRDSHKSLWTGAGLGQFKGQNVVGMTPFAKRNIWLLRGSNTFSFFLIVELGYLGIIWSIFTLVSMFTPSSCTRNGINQKIYMGLITAFLYIYNPSLTILYFCAIFFYMIMRTYYVRKDEPHLKEDYLSAQESPDDAAHSETQFAINS